jgi:nitrite reductase/ring-hydroxylating ferredoxin subunit
MRRLSLGSVSTLEPGRARCVENIIVVLAGDGVRAFRNECKHQPTPLNPAGEDLIIDGALVCKSHGARYTLDDGLCFSGPCRGAFLDPVRLDRVGDELFAVLPD